jgi:hypothetical protein
VASKLFAEIGLSGSWGIKKTLQLVSGHRLDLSFYLSSRDYETPVSHLTGRVKIVSEKAFQSHNGGWK